MNDLKQRTLTDAPPNEPRLRGIVSTCEPETCTRCGRVLMADEPDGLCDHCAIASANAEERRADLDRLMQRHGVRYVEDLPTRVLQQHQADHRKGVF